ncbi:MAG: hypothetical protein QOJ50_1950, partial [Cryptosporangiaceae bacterium]|nr:hypothetical protein [Cryptosporangiaceae bacterium]
GNAFPQSLTVDLGASRPLGRIVLSLPPSPAWGPRTQTVAVAGSADGSAFTTLRAAAGYAFSASTGNTATIGVSGSARYVRLTFTANTGWPAAQAAEAEVYSAGGTTTPPPPVGNLALGAATTESGHVQNYGSANAVDGDPGTYWESPGTAFPQSLTVDLGSSQALGRAVVRLPAGWGSRSQTIAVSGSADGTAFSALKTATAYGFDPVSGNTVTIPLTGTARYVRITVSANTGWPAAQASEVELWAP